MMWTIKWNPWSASSNSPALSLYLLLYFILEGFLILSSGAFTVFGPLVQPTLAWVREDVLLSCHLSPRMDARGMTVKWVRGPLVVHLYHKGKEMKEPQAPAFQGRTEMLRQDMEEGKVTVKMHQVRFSDAGQYTCLFKSGTFYNETSFDLHVAEILSTFLRIHLVIAIPSGLSVLVIGFVLSILYKIYGLGARAPACKNSQLQEEDREAAGSSLSLPETSSKDCRRFSTHFQPPASKIMKFYSKKSTEDSEVLESLTST